MSDSTWAAVGILSDACQCRVFCSCEFEDKPTFGHCDDAEIMKIDQGHYRGVDVSGKTVIVVTQSPEGERVVDTVGKLNFAHIYVPNDASEQQADALAAIARLTFGAVSEDETKGYMISPLEKVERADIQATLEPNHERWAIPGVLELDFDTVTGGDGKTPIVIKNNPFTAYGFGDVEVGRSNTYTYNAGGQKWDYSGRNASRRTFTLGGKVAPPTGT